MTTVRKAFTSVAQFVVLFILFVVFFVAGSMAVVGVIPEGASSEPGLVSAESGLLLIALCDTLLVGAMVLTSRWRGWFLAWRLALAYYGAVTVLIQIETWYFLSSVTVGPQLLPRLFLMGIPTAFLFIPLAVWILGRGRPAGGEGTVTALVMPRAQWVWKLATVSVSYVVLYWLAGYFIAWQNADLRAFYGHAGDAKPFLEHTLNTLRSDPFLFPFQALRALLWTACALPIIRGSRVNAWWTALLVGLFFSVPQNLSHIIENPLIPIASVRLSHLLETASSTFLFGALVVWLLHREHSSLADLMGRSTT